MTLETRARPTGPYSLRLTARAASDATRTFRDDTLTAVLPGGAGPELATARQLAEGTVLLRAATEEGLERLRFVLALDDDHTEFLRRFASDPLIGKATRELRGLRPLRTATVAHALLRALAGQLIQSGRARAIERSVVRRAGTPLGALTAPPSTRELGRLPPAALCALGLSARKAATLVRLCAAGDLERLRDVPSAAILARFERERGLGPWSAGVVCLQGLGRYDVGLVGDLGLVRLLGSLRGRRVDAAETAELLEPYGEWAGLAGLYLLSALKAGLPLQAAA